MAGGIISRIIGLFTGKGGKAAEQEAAEEVATRAQQRLDQVMAAGSTKAEAPAIPKEDTASVSHNMPQATPDRGAEEARQSVTDSETPASPSPDPTETSDGTDLAGAVEDLVERAGTAISTASEEIGEAVSETVAGILDDPAPEFQTTNNLDNTSEEDFMSSVSMTVNGKAVSGEVEDRTLLVQFIRDNLRLTGTHVGCDTSQCGACVVHVNGKAVKSCTMLAVQADGADVVTIEGLASGGQLHPVQAAFKENHGLQCGFCTPGMIMSAVDMIERHKAKGSKLDEKTIRAELEGNICRCTGYHNIVKSIQAAADASA